MYRLNKELLATIAVLISRITVGANIILRLCATFKYINDI